MPMTCILAYIYYPGGIRRSAKISTVTEEARARIFSARTFLAAATTLKSGMQTVALGAYICGEETG